MKLTDKLSLYNCDCMEFMATISDKYFELAIVDPPYGIGENGQRNLTGDRPTTKWKNPKSQIYKPFNDSKTPNQLYFTELKRISKNQIIWGGNNFTDFLDPSTGWIVWDKKVDIKEHLSMCELAWSSFNIKCNKFEFLWAGFKKGEQVARINPCQKPVALYKWLLSKYAKQGDKIFDSHLGSMSIAIACHDYGFDLTGCELDVDYYNQAIERVKRHIAQPVLFQAELPICEQQSLF
jgi:site-specific DNA-methyltransferase (adenine-specific)